MHVFYTFFPNTSQLTAIRKTFRSILCKDDKQLIILFSSFHNRCCSDMAFWVIIQCRVINLMWCFGGTSCPHLYGDGIRFDGHWGDLVGGSVLIIQEGCKECEKYGGIPICSWKDLSLPFLYLTNLAAFLYNQHISSSQSLLHPLNLL